jgi:hypothetical protein
MLRILLEKKDREQAKLSDCLPRQSMAQGEIHISARIHTCRKP